MAREGQVLVQVWQATMQFIGLVTTAFLASKSKRYTSRPQLVTQVPHPMQASTSITGYQGISSRGTPCHGRVSLLSAVLHPTKDPLPSNP